MFQLFYALMSILAPSFDGMIFELLVSNRNIFSFCVVPGKGIACKKARVA
jgi:hypothetical protein